MSSFHPLGSGDQHPLTASTIPFHHPSRGNNDNNCVEEDDWSPPSLPGDRLPSRLTSSISNPLKGNKNYQHGASPLEAPLDPLLNTLPPSEDGGNDGDNSHDTAGGGGARFGQQRGAWGPGDGKAIIDDDDSGRRWEQQELREDERRMEGRDAAAAAGAVGIPPPSQQQRALGSHRRGQQGAGKNILSFSVFCQA